MCNTVKRDLTPQGPNPRKPARLFWTSCSLLFDRVALAVLNWGPIQQAGEECSARVPSLAWQLGSHGKGATSWKRFSAPSFLGSLLDLLSYCAKQTCLLFFSLHPVFGKSSESGGQCWMLSPGTSRWDFPHTPPNCSWAHWVPCGPKWGIQWV